MSKPLENNKIRYRFFMWSISQRNGIYYADGRSNSPKLGRFSLETRDNEDAKKKLHDLDQLMAVKHKRADRSILLQSDLTLELTFEDAWLAYDQHISRPVEIGGIAKSSRARYYSTYLSFRKFADKKCIKYWNQVNKQLLEQYVTYRKGLEDAFTTIVNDVTNIKTMMNWLIEENYLPQSCKIKLQVSKIGKSDRYCYTGTEVEAMISYCKSQDKLAWLHHIIVGLSHTGLRISELAGLRWSDITTTEDCKMIGLIDERAYSRSSAPIRNNKNHQSRVLPVHPRLAEILNTIPFSEDGYIFRNSQGRRLVGKNVYKTFARNVLMPLAHMFPSSPGAAGFVDGTIHSFRHYFISECINQNIPREVILNWVGQSNSEILNLYYSLKANQSVSHMSKLRFGSPSNQ